MENASPIDDKSDSAPLASNAASAGPHRARGTTLIEILFVFLRLGCISFGGPIAHLGYLRAELVDKRKWVDDEHYGDLVALCQFLPGPASSQVVFSLGLTRAGWAGGLLASIGFTLPSAVLMIAFAYGVTKVGDLQSAGWLHGLKLAAVAVVAQAVWGMGKKLCPDRARITIALASAAVLLLFPGVFAQIGVIAAGATIGWWWYRQSIPTAMPSTLRPRGVRGHLGASLTLGIFAILLVVLPPLAAATGSRATSEFDSFYRSGSLVFGGGHVVLPLLRAEIVPKGWLTDDQFLAGYGAAQAIPGPLFTFAAYLGTAMHPGPDAWIAGLACLFAIFLPAWLLVGGALPFWQDLRRERWMQAALAGANASVVGVLLAAFYSPVFVEGVRQKKDVVAAIVSFALLEQWKVPPWVVVVGMAAAGQWLLR